MSQPAVSIIVAVYNVENLIRRCLDSIRAQSFSDFEVILINDGSKDNSGKICDEYAQTDQRFKVIHQNNQGVSRVRERGIKESSGIYTIHVDPDDWIEKGMIEQLIKTARMDDADIVICDYFVNKGNSQITKCERPLSLNPQEVLLELFYRISGSLCNKLIKRELYDGISFINGISCGEDYLTCMRLLKKANRISYTSQAFYHYDISSNGESLTKSNDIAKFQADEDKILEIYRTEILENKYTKEYNSQVASFAWAAFVKGLYTSSAYRNRYLKKSKYLLINLLPLPIRILSFVSALGFYPICKKTYDFAIRRRK